MPKYVGGAGRGHKGVTVLDDPSRPEHCERCGGFFKSNGIHSWKCVECGHTLTKHGQRRMSDDLMKVSSVRYKIVDGEYIPVSASATIDKSKQIDPIKLVESFGKVLKKYKPLKKIKAKARHDKDLLCIYPLGDPHLGMYSWAAETGQDFDCDIAERDLRQAFHHLMSKTPNAETAIILNLGDMFHSDGSFNATTKGTQVDVDTRWARVLDIGMNLMIDSVYLALEKHKKVIVRNNPGNHDFHTSQALSTALRYVFKNNPRVEIYPAQKAFFAYEFGNNAIFSTHGDKTKPKKMQGVISNYFPAIWGRTQHRLCLVGHFHHEARIEEHGLLIEIFNTLAAQDAWHHSSGFLSKRNMKAIVLDKEFGEAERYTFSINR